MTVELIPSLGLGLIMAAYWIYVGVMVIRIGGRTHRLQHMVVPAQKLERLMLLVWLPLVWAWINLPICTVLPPWIRFNSFAAPAFLFDNTALTIVRFIAFGVALACLAASIYCWRFMGNNWRMAIDPGAERTLMQEGPFARVRHPIYSLSILLMLCSIVILPTIHMLIVAVVHISLLLLKARNEEAFLHDRFGPQYEEYCRRTGRFLPRLSPDRSPAPGAGGSPSRDAGKPVTVKLNHFQRAMLLWEQRHPYNALHAVQLRGASDPATLKVAIRTACQAAGIRDALVNEQAGLCTYLTSITVDLTELPQAAQVDEVIRQAAAPGMNARFSKGSHHPIRWYVANLNGDAGHAIVAVYHHVFADAAGIEALLARVLRNYLNDETPAPVTAITLEAPAADPDTRRPFLRYGFFRSYAQTIAMCWRVFWSRRPHVESAGDDRTDMVVRAAPEDLLVRLQRRCTKFEIGVNDQFLAALATTLASHLTPSANRVWRPRIVLGTVLSRRGKWSPEMAESFGVCISDVLLFIDNPEDAIDVVARRIAAQTKAFKADPRKADAISDMRLFLAKLSWPFLQNSRQSYRRCFPVCGGVSTVMVNKDRFGAAAEKIVRYVRACPPGPVMPIVLAPTIYGNRIEFTLVHRLSCMTTAEAHRFLDAAIMALDQFAAVERSAPVELAGKPERLEKVPSLT